MSHKHYSWVQFPSPLPNIWAMQVSTGIKALHGKISGLGFNSQIVHHFQNKTMKEVKEMKELKNTYKNIHTKGKTYGEHRIVWIKHNGEIPEGHLIHHDNGIKDDNRIENLRCVTYSEHAKIHKFNIPAESRATFEKGHIPYNRKLSGKEIENVRNIIKDREGTSLAKLAKTIGCKESLLKDISAGRTYAV